MLLFIHKKYISFFFAYWQHISCFKVFRLALSQKEAYMFLFVADFM